MTEQELTQKATKLIHRFDNMRIVGARGEWSGNARQGFAFNPKHRGGGTSTPTLGSCCIGTGFWYGSCFDGYTRAQCEDDPTVQGVWHPEPCDAGVNCVFACCHDGICSDETQAHCLAIGGTFFNTNTFCTDDPPPDCSIPPECPVDQVRVDLIDFPIACPCFFNAGFPNHWDSWDISGIPTSFMMSYSIGLGGWRADFSGALVVTQHSDPGCNVVTGSFAVDAIAVFLCSDLGSGLYTFYINTNPGSAFFTFYSTGSFFGSSITASSDRCCPTDPTCHTGGIAHGGTALLTW